MDYIYATAAENCWEGRGAGGRGQWVGDANLSTMAFPHQYQLQGVWLIYSKIIIRDSCNCLKVFFDDILVDAGELNLLTVLLSL